MTSVFIPSPKGVWVGGPNGWGVGLGSISRWLSLFEEGSVLINSETVSVGALRMYVSVGTDIEEVVSGKDVAGSENGMGKEWIKS